MHGLSQSKVAGEDQNARSQLAILLQEQAFMLKSMSYLASKIARGAAYRVNTKQISTSFCGYEDRELAGTQEGTRKILMMRKDTELISSLILSVLQWMVAETLQTPLPEPTAPEVNTPEFMLRLILPDSATRFDPALGFVCGKFLSC
ncbi:hypothetical protein H634G_10995 [Metarhizium anisopliae BRIP 53293]|uniref:Uncharacterized protein n=1 Tax=Metarhizium anisopliae BRIP 53293 TaxID=1291518 RepID=A0A0D9NIJ7_METAN|nr:hypothetical protein H634G_10995 [Metarhizium anisopliae BRIP 53293]